MVQLALGPACNSYPWCAPYAARCMLDTRCPWHRPLAGPGPRRALQLAPLRLGLSCYRFLRLRRASRQRRPQVKLGLHSQTLAVYQYANYPPKGEEHLQHPTLAVD